VNIVFWTIVALDLAMFLVGLISTMTQHGPNDGGREMALFFGLLFPAAVIGAAVLLYVFARSPAWRVIALVIVAGPGLFIAGSRLRNAWIEHQVAEDLLGRGHFSGRVMKQMGEAVVKRDVATLTRLAPQADLNAAGPEGMTLVRLAVEQADTWQSRADVPPALPVVQSLLRLGARPGPGLETATKLKSPDVLRTLLDAGADPNLGRSADPVVFHWIGVMPLTSLQLLAERGLDLDLVDRDGTPLVVAVAEQVRWDLLLFLVEKGADDSRPDRQGRTVLARLNDRIEIAAREGQEPPEALVRARAALTARTAAPPH
jgi:hypothetical protein